MVDSIVMADLEDMANRFGMVPVDSSIDTVPTTWFDDQTVVGGPAASPPSTPGISNWVILPSGLAAFIYTSLGDLYHVAIDNHHLVLLTITSSYLARATVHVQTTENIPLAGALVAVGHRSLNYAWQTYEVLPVASIRQWAIDTNRDIILPGATFIWRVGSKAVVGMTALAGENPRFFAGTTATAGAAGAAFYFRHEIKSYVGSILGVVAVVAGSAAVIQYMQEAPDNNTTRPRNLKKRRLTT